MINEELKEKLLGEITQYLTRPSIVNILVTSTKDPTIFNVIYFSNT